MRMCRWMAVLAAVGIVLGAGGCSSQPANNGIFNPSTAGAGDCMKHQTQSPGSAYTGDAPSKLGSTLEVFRYYTENGSKPYCDGAGPTAIDKRWARFVVDAQGPVSSVQPILDAPGN